MLLLWIIWEWHVKLFLGKYIYKYIFNLLFKYLNGNNIVIYLSSNERFLMGFIFPLLFIYLFILIDYPSIEQYLYSEDLFGIYLLIDFLINFQIRFASVDLELHTRYIPGGSESIYDVDRKICERTQVLPPLPEDRFLCSFSHIFAGLLYLSNLISKS